MVSLIYEVISSSVVSRSSLDIQIAFSGFGATLTRTLVLTLFGDSGFPITLAEVPFNTGLFGFGVGFSVSFGVRVDLVVFGVLPST